MTTFEQLSVGEQFEFATKTNVGCGKYNGVFRKISSHQYRGQCFTGCPEPSVEVSRSLSLQQIRNLLRIAL